MKYSSVCEFQFFNKEPSLCTLWCVNLKAAISFKNLLKNKDPFYFPIPVAQLALIFLLGNKFHWILIVSIPLQFANEWVSFSHKNWNQTYSKNKIQCYVSELWMHLS